jgi:outer membrane protein assembly factor BamB
LKPVLAIVCLSFLAGEAVGAAQDWPQFRGRQGGVAVDHPALPDSWSETRNVTWKIDIPGRGWSSPVVWGDHVFVTTAINVRQPKQTLLPPDVYRGASTGGTMSRRDLVRDTDEFRWMLYDVDAASGRVRWERVIHTAVPTRPVHLKNSYASETPVTDGERVYVYLGYVGLFAYDMNGALVWARPMDAKNTGNDGYFYGGAASPALHGGRIYIVNDNEEGSFAAAFDAKTGAPLWRVARDERSNWSTPYVWQNDRRTEIVTVGSRKVRSYDVDGTLLWELAVGTTLHTPTPFAQRGILYASSGYFSDPRRPVFAIRPGASGDISLKGDETANAFIVWSQPTASATYPSAIAVGDQFYTLLDRGFLTAHDANTGKVIYGRQRIAVDAGAFTASPWSYNGRIFVLSEDGDTFVIQAGPEYKLLGRNSLNEMTLASPAVAGSSLFIRTATRLFRMNQTAAITIDGSAARTTR